MSKLAFSTDHLALLAISQQQQPKNLMRFTVSC